MKYMKCLIWTHSFCISETDQNEVRTIFDNLIREAGFGIVGFMEHYFSTDGIRGSYVATWVLAESHFTLRIFPNKEMTYCEISSCNRDKYAVFLKLVELITVSTTKLEFWSYKVTISLTDQKKLQEIFSRLLPKATFRVVGFAEYVFPGDGCTLAWLGEDWHLNIHTFPEDGKSDVEVGSFSRGRYCMMIKMLDEESIKKMSIMI
jgi:S-adenosylmethionine decarboxylase